MGMRGINTTFLVEEVDIIESVFNISAHKPTPAPGAACLPASIGGEPYAAMPMNNLMNARV
jgi:hypothetical protein